MRPIQELVQEHNAIERMLGVLESACSRLERVETVETEDLGNIVEFFKLFADGCHHTKEEELLFPAMERMGVGRDRGPIGVMLSEHELGRKHIREMSNAIREMTHGDPEARLRFARNGLAYIGLLSAHIQKENHILFPMADRVLSEETQQQLARDFQRIETERVGDGKHLEFHQLLDRLESRYAV